MIQLRAIWLPVARYHDQCSVSLFMFQVQESEELRKAGGESLTRAHGNKQYINLALLRAIKY